MKLKNLFVALTAATVLSTPAIAEFPERPIELIVPSSPGGGSDTAARTIAPALEKHLGGASIAVVNKPGGGATLGIGAVAAAKPDGYTIGQLQSPQVVSKQFESEAITFGAGNFEYIGVVTTDSLAIGVLKDSTIKDHAGLVEAAASGTVNCAVTGSGGGPQLATLQYVAAGGAKLNLINFDGGGEARAAVLGGHVDAVCINIGGMAKALKDLNVLVIASPERNALVPETPTARELGIDVVAGTQRVLAVPAGTPGEVTEKLRAAYEATMQDADFLASAKKAKMQLDPTPGGDVAGALKKQEDVYRDLWATSPWIQDR